MPGSVKVSVLEAEQLPSTVKDGDLVSIRVSVGKREYQTKPSQAFGGRTAPWRSEFSYPATNLRDNLLIAAVDSNEGIITKSEIQTPAIIQKGLWESFFSLKGGGRLHLRLCFVLSDEERKKIETMRREALQRRGLQNMLYRSAFQMPKPVPVKPTRSLLSGVTITEIPADSCLYGKDEDKENRVANPLLRGIKLLEAPKEKKTPNTVNDSNAIVPFSQCLDDSKVKANILDGPLSPKLVTYASCEINQKKVSKRTEDPSKGDEAHVLANSNVPSLLLPEASVFMNDLVPSTIVSEVNLSPSPPSDCVTVGMLCETAAVTAVPNVGSISMSLCVNTESQPGVEPVEIPVISEESAVNSSLGSVGSGNPISFINSESTKDASDTSPLLNGNTQNDSVILEGTQAFDTAGRLADEQKITSPEDSIAGSTNTGSTHLFLNMAQEINSDTLPSNHTGTNPARVENTNEMLQLSETLSHKVNDGMLDSVTVKVEVKKMGLEKEAEDARTTTESKLLKTLPWKSQMKGASEKFGFNVSKKKRAESEHNGLAAQNEKLMEPAVSEKNEVNVAVDKEADAKKGLFGISGLVKKWAGVALLLAGVVVLGYDAIQRDLAAKESYHAGSKERSCTI